MGAQTDGRITGRELRRSPDEAGYDILVLDAEHKQALAAARSLGREGLRVALGESLTLHRENPPLPSFRSRYCSRSVVLPSYDVDPGLYVAAVIDFVRENPTRVVLPVGDATCVTLMPYRRELADLGCVLALPPDSALAIALDKDRTLEVARQLGIAYPRFLTLRTVEDLPTAIDEFGFPFVLKPTASWTAERRDRVGPVEVIDKAEAMQEAARLLAGSPTILAQQLATGRREGVTLLMVGGEAVASCGHVEHRTTPPLGGASVLRESIQTPPDVYEPAVRLAAAIGIEGVCEVEFRRDAAGRPLLMEINPRLPGTLDTATKAGVNFALLVWQWATGQPVTHVMDYRSGVRTRSMHGELRWLRDNYSRVGRPDSVSRTRSAWNFFAEFARTHSYDYFDWRDLKPAIAQLRYTIAVARKSLRE